MGWKIASDWITSQRPDKAYNTKKWKKKTARTPENIAPVRAASHAVLRCASSATVANWGIFYELCKCSTRFLTCCFSELLRSQFVNMLIGSWNTAVWMGLLFLWHPEPCIHIWEIQCTYYNYFPWASGRLNSPVTEPPVGQHVRAGDKENIKAPYCWQFVRRGAFPSQKASNTESFPVSWRHHTARGRIYARNQVSALN